MSASQSRALTVLQRVGDAYLNRARMIRRHIAFSDGDATLPRAHLDSVIRDAQTHRKSEGFP
jgi:hypothetical protein